jgi:hypothetical protein
MYGVGTGKIDKEILGSVGGFSAGGGLLGLAYLLYNVLRLNTPESENKTSGQNKPERQSRTASQ